eukprot:TRINITY_DN6831_c2_g1_i1.p1 TRINITY_DN6831_c2_g1~~TRINITY_DN6831_c2_g1_i1.p1  ORF type:complete len:122 (-),score=7.63 TRINITY_DN6831_c2_g1_i1:71-436(-)
MIDKVWLPPVQGDCIRFLLSSTFLSSFFGYSQHAVVLLSFKLVNDTRLVESMSSGTHSCWRSLFFIKPCKSAVASREYMIGFGFVCSVGLATKARCDEATFALPVAIASPKKGPSKRGTRK